MEKLVKLLPAGLFGEIIELFSVLISLSSGSGGELKDSPLREVALIGSWEDG
jgi:hypothetical protein